MIIVNIVGGLGNQMFQYAYAKALEQKGNNVKIDISAYKIYTLHGGYQLNKYNIDLPISTKNENSRFYKDDLLHKILKKIKLYIPKIIQEKSLLYDSNFLQINDDSYVDGYFQSEKYFSNIRDILLKQFTIKQSVSSYTIEMKNIILGVKSSCSLHIRRGDFTNSINVNIHGVCRLDYYQRAIEYLKNRYDNVKFFIFSDDIDWVRGNMKLENVVYVNNIKHRLPHEDIYLMSLCSHNIIANSSFSWWGAWLNQNDEKIVVAPKKWFADNALQAHSDDIYCRNWIKL